MSLSSVPLPPASSPITLLTLPIRVLLLLPPIRVRLSLFPVRARTFPVHTTIRRLILPTAIISSRLSRGTFILFWVTKINFKRRARFSILIFCIIPFLIPRALFYFFSRSSTITPILILRALFSSSNIPFVPLIF